MQSYSKITILLLLILFTISCKDKRFKAHLKGIKADVEINRIDQKLAEIDKKNYFEKMDKIFSEYPEFGELLLSINGEKMDSGTTYSEKFMEFYTDRYTIDLVKDVKNKFPDLTFLKNDMGKAFKRIKYFYPKDTLPEIYTVVTNFSFGATKFKQMLVVSLDMYLGQDYIYYPDLFYHYQIRRMRPEYISNHLIEAYFMGKYPEDQYAGNDLLSHMIYNGKMLLFSELMAPWLQDTIRMEYKKEELKWCTKYEGQLWNQLLENKVLYDTELQNYSRYIEDGPFTKAYGIPQDSPPRIGNFLGYCILKSYLKHNKSASVIDLLNEKDAKKILIHSQYKPKLY